MHFKMFLLELKFWQIKRIIWNRGIFLFWCLLWDRKNEFHYSLSIDLDALVGASPRFEKWYLASIMVRREVAHKKDLKLTDRIFFFKRMIWKNA